jgi:hypothetical protein
MTIYNVHIYRKMRLVYGGVEANSHEAAAAIARDKPSDQADAIDDCDGDTSYACVDVQGDEDYEQSRWIDFEPERERIAARELLAAVEAFLEADELAEECYEWKWENLAHAFRLARAARAEAKAAGIVTAPRTPKLKAALTWLLDDLTDAGQDRDPETGVEYDSVAFARAALAEPASAC